VMCGFVGSYFLLRGADAGWAACCGAAEAITVIWTGRREEEEGEEEEGLERRRGRGLERTGGRRKGRGGENWSEGWRDPYNRRGETQNALVSPQTTTRHRSVLESTLARCIQASCTS
jgi:hypothetical protein